MQYVYILRCRNGKTYVGCTQDLKERFGRHCRGYVPATKHYLPVVLLFYCAFPNKLKAFEFEKYLKSSSGRAFMNKRLFD
ncbi:MAG: GIY-YIG nuclease family protein [Chitinophagaceae bacterium]|nr:GIY-YIG nuclease family protein [Chitinophagaceae bacterium]